MVSGYRWPTLNTEALSTSTLGGQVIAAIDRGISALPRLRSQPVVWGGSLALSRHAWHALPLEKVLAHTLTDDCSIGLQAQALGLRTLVRGALRVPSPVDGNLMTAWRFGRRQYQIVHIYVPRLWHWAWINSTVRVAAWVVLFAHWSNPMTAPLFLALLLVAVLGSLVQNRVAHKLQCADSSQTLRVQLTLALVRPALDLFHWTLIVAAFDTRYVQWGHVRYRIRGPRDIQVVHATEVPLS